MYRAVMMSQTEANERAKNMFNAVNANTIQHWGAYFEKEPQRIMALRNIDSKIKPELNFQIK
jgi:trehalose-6-phosphate synthase